MAPVALDGSDGAHNPKVAGSNPAPATKRSLPKGMDQKYRSPDLAPSESGLRAFRVSCRRRQWRRSAAVGRLDNATPKDGVDVLGHDRSAGHVRRGAVMRLAVLALARNVNTSACRATREPHETTTRSRPTAECCKARACHANRCRWRYVTLTLRWLASTQPGECRSCGAAHSTRRRSSIYVAVVNPVEYSLISRFLDVMEQCC